METLGELLERAEHSHGHMCAGQVLGVRMAMLGCKAIGIGDPRGADSKSLIVFVEIDRCAADAIHTVTGCRLGKRTLKYHDYGKLAATFLNTKSGAGSGGSLFS
jgi:formylmethanofuran dehydrogenase subunit E